MLSDFIMFQWLSFGHVICVNNLAARRPVGFNGGWASERISELGSHFKNSFRRRIPDHFHGYPRKALADILSGNAGETACAGLA